MPGTLYVVATPLGNLGDLSARAIEVLRRVAVVAAEDTRHSRGLLAHLDAHPRLVAFHAHSTDRQGERLLDVLRAGEDVALVTDAGTPLVSDPGLELVQGARAAGIAVVPVPGPSAVATALSAAGLPADRYLFLGFVPRKGRERSRLLARAARSEDTVVFFESPHRLGALLAELAALAAPARVATVARELTKLHEEFRTGTLAALAGYYAEHPPRGECTVVVAGTGEAAPEDPAVEAADPVALARTWLGAGESRKDVARRLTEELGMARNEAYRIATELA